MKRTATVLLIALIAIALVAPSAAAAKKKKKGKKKSSTPAGSSTRMFDAGVDLGLPVFGVLQLGNIEYADADEDIDFSGSGSVSFPYLGAHFSLYPARDWYIQFGIGYIHHSGEAEYKSDDNDDLDGEEFDWSTNMFRLDAGIGKIFGKYSKIRPKAGAGLGIYYLSFYDQDDKNDETFSGWTVAPYGLVGVDFDVTRVKKVGDVFAGVNLRTDLIYPISPLEYSGKTDAEMVMLYMPWSIFLSGGLRF